MGTRLKNFSSTTTTSTTSTVAPSTTAQTTTTQAQLPSTTVIAVSPETSQLPTTLAPIVPTTVHDHGSHSHGNLPQTGTNSILIYIIAIGLFITGPLVLTLNQEKK